MSRIDNNLAALRQKRGISAAHLAQLAGVSRQTIYAMEAGSYVPNTAVALKLGRALETSVEDLFRLEEDGPPLAAHLEEATLLDGSDPLQPGQPVQLCTVDKRVIAAAPSPVRWYLPASDGVAVHNLKPGGKAKIQVFNPESSTRNRILVAGCDPGIAVLARHVQAAGIELVLVHRNSSQALKLLKEGSVHIAGTHLRDEASGESNIPAIGKIFPKRAVAVISFAVWEEGIVTAPGNPKSIHGVEDFARHDVLMVNREPGAGSRNLLDSQLKRIGVDPRMVHGYEDIGLGHLPVAWQVLRGAADCCIATRAAARVFGLKFIPLISERYDLAIHRRHLELPSMQALLDTLARSSFRRELEGLGGYDTKDAGRRML